MIVAYHQIGISDASHPGEARRAAARVAEKVAFSETRAGELSIVVMELAKNILAHAKSGELLLLGWQEGRMSGVDLLSLDKGPGIANLQKSLQDGYSSAGTPGNGLGAVSRLTSGFDVYSGPSHGTALFARLLDQSKAQCAECAVEIGGLLSPIHGESVCGDGLAVRWNDQRCICMAVDGLGHGLGAAEAAQAAIDIFEGNWQRSPESIMHRLHDGLRPTRGAVAAVAELDFSAGKLRYCGVGNISGQIISAAKSQSLVSHNGTLGHVMARAAELEYEFPPKSLLILHSDGVSTQWNLDKYAGLRQRHPGLIAGMLYRDFKRGRDDASILAIRENAKAHLV